MTSLPAVRARRRNQLPDPAREQLPIPQRIVTSWWTWLAVGMVIVFAACLASLFFDVTADKEVNEGVVPGVNPSAIRQAAWYATSTLVFWVVVFLAADRFRPQRWIVWFLSLGWGASVATYLSYYANSWAAQQMAVTGDFDPATSARAAVFVAPFVEEAAKATVLFWLAILARYRFVSKVSLIVMGGLSGAGFAFTENIIYYARAIVYASQTIEVGDADAAIAQIVWLRGFWTAFGHPLFTMMTAIGVAVALRTHSKVVRVLAPLAGYGTAALLHMVFNSQATLTSGDAQVMIYFLVAVPMVFSAVVYVVRQGLKQGHLIRVRLTDYVQMGWLEPTDPFVFSRQRSRWRSLLVALTRGWTALIATVSLQRAVTELAYLRDAEVKGVVDATAALRAKELIERVGELRTVGISDPRGLKLSLPRLRRRPLAGTSEPGGPPAGGLADPAATPGQPPPVGSQRYSVVDPTWGPPGG